MRPLRKDGLGLGEALKDPPLFSILDEGQRNEVAEIASLREFDPGEAIVNEGETATSFYVILQGQVEVRQAKSTLARLGRGQFFGETTVAEDQTRSADVVALQRTVSSVEQAAAAVADYLEPGRCPETP